MNIRKNFQHQVHIEINNYHLPNDHSILMNDSKQIKMGTTIKRETSEIKIYFLLRLACFVAKGNTILDKAMLNISRYDGIIRHLYKSKWSNAVRRKITT